MIFTKDYIQFWLSLVLQEKIVVWKIQELRNSATLVLNINDEFILKSFFSEDKKEKSRFRKETRNQKLISGFFCTPEVLHIDKLNDIIIYRYIKPKLSHGLILEDKVLIFFRIQQSLGKLNPSSFKKNYPPQLFSKSYFIQKLSTDLALSISKWKKKYVHETCVHGDLKSDNIIILSENDYYVIDWENAGIGDEVFELSYFVSSLILYDTDNFEILDFTGRSDLVNFITHNPEYKVVFKNIYLRNTKKFRKFLAFLSISIIWRIVIDNEYQINQIKDNFYFKLSTDLLSAINRNERII
ncbi:phosphotransferase [Lacihabitans sp. LS3-19]|uniref:phosphotransferase n=1 Tax=Lacihabitans sp. LS3-19 TaxID=2487335 RepID=UPI0020CDC2DF|nr:phosphotransferase [Lacihabitans sp. LS3-19]